MFEKTKQSFFNFTCKEHSMVCELVVKRLGGKETLDIPPDDDVIQKSRREMELVVRRQTLETIQLRK